MFISFRNSTRKYSSVKLVESIPEFAPKSTIFSLIQPTGKIHLGNYLGAVRNWKDISDYKKPDSTVIFGTADLHAITLPQDPDSLRKWRYETLASLVSSGINPEKCVLYHQSSVPEHTELCWLLICLSSMGSLNRMTQWKLKTKQNHSASIFDEDILSNTRAGVLCYPVLQAADVLIYKSTHVPVGEDQSQHLELCRNIAATFNNTYKSDFFPLPQTLITPTKKILSLRNPEKKMSKSDPDESSCIYVIDSPDVIKKKIRRAVTDSIQGPIYFDPEKRPGVSNLINIISGLTRKLVEDTVKELSWVKDHKQLKDHVSDILIHEFEGQRKTYKELMKDHSYIDEVSKKGTEKARDIALKNLLDAKKLVGLV
ncbi:uncharacterized protein PRCAT00000977001 [Priceomyces carsonii]|uniref:uncharacterized protein n=1 Tax=Priceomyces carsonii TaxID=28549 RepID=UPI002ED9B247|nr:unnamed protein product [Priceomyces carsonii]